MRIFAWQFNALLYFKYQLRLKYWNFYVKTNFEYWFFAWGVLSCIGCLWIDRIRKPGENVNNIKTASRNQKGKWLPHVWRSARNFEPKSYSKEWTDRRLLYSWDVRSGIVTDGSTLSRHLKKHFLKHHLCTVCGKEFDTLAEITGSTRIVCERVCIIYYFTVIF